MDSRRSRALGCPETANCTACRAVYISAQFKAAVWLNEILTMTHVHTVPVVQSAILTILSNTQPMIGSAAG